MQLPVPVLRNDERLKSIFNFTQINKTREGLTLVSLQVHKIFMVRHLIKYWNPPDGRLSLLPRQVEK